MDLSLIKPLDTIKVEIDHPALEGVAFTLSGPSHPVTRKAEKARMDAVMASKRKMRGDAMDAILVDFLAARVIAWENVEWKGVALECTPANVAEVLEQGPRFIREQLLAALGDDELLYKSN